MITEPGGNCLVIPVPMLVTIFPIIQETTILGLQQVLRDKRQKSANDGVEMKWSEGCQEG
jgi:hypothetical protein